MQKRSRVKMSSAVEKLTDSGLLEKARQKMMECSREQLFELLEYLINEGTTTPAFLASNLLDLGADDVALLLESILEMEKRNGIIHVEAERRITQILSPVLDRSRKCMAKKQYVQAIEPVLPILVIIEREMQYVYDEGWTFQCLIEECFKLLQDVVREDYQMKTADIMRKMIVSWNKKRSVCNSLYDEEWAEMAESLSNRSEK